jgi:hypothetical protein
MPHQQVVVHTPSSPPAFPDGAVLFTVADNQAGGTGIVRSLIGPDGTLLPGTTVDMSYPPRFVFGEAPQRGITYGDVLLDTINAPFTVGVAFELGGGPAAPLHQEIPLVSKWDIQHGVSNYIGFEIYGASGDGPACGFAGVIANMKFSKGVWTNYDTSSPLLPGFVAARRGKLDPGFYTLGFSYDWSSPRGRRTRWWFQGQPIESACVHEHAYGVETHPIVTDAPFQFSGDFGTDRTESPESGKAVVVAEGVKGDLWHAQFHQTMVDKGWVVAVDA